MKHNRIGAGGTKVKGKKAAAILFTDGKAMLLLKRAGEGDHIGAWALPGGKAKDGETEIGNAVREVKEETGLGDIPGYRFNSMTVKNGQQRFTTFFYKVPEPFTVNLSKEHSDWEWINFDDLPKTKLHPKFKDAIPECLRIIRRNGAAGRNNTEGTGGFAEWVRLSELMAALAE